MKQAFEQFPGLTEHILRMASTGETGNGHDWSAFLEELNNVIARDHSPKWISVRERLPLSDATVIVGWGDHCTVGYYHAKNKLWYPAHPAPYDLPVTEWMPLPDSPNPTTRTN